MKIPLVDLKAQYRNLHKDIDKTLIKVAASGYYIKGPNLSKFEQKFAKFIGTRYCVGVASGTDALKLSLTTLDIHQGDEVILPANTFIATPYAVLATGARPILVDADKNSLSIDPDLIERAITKRTKAISPKPPQATLYNSSHRTPRHLSMVNLPLFGVPWRSDSLKIGTSSFETLEPANAK